MDEAINPDLEVKFLYPYILDLYKKKFADVPNISRNNNFAMDFGEKKKKLLKKNKIMFLMILQRVYIKNFLL